MTNKLHQAAKSALAGKPVSPLAQAFYHFLLSLPIILLAAALPLIGPLLSAGDFSASGWQAIALPLFIALLGALGLALAHFLIALKNTPLQRAVELIAEFLDTELSTYSNDSPLLQALAKLADSIKDGLQGNE